MTTAAQAIEEVCEDARYVVVTPIGLTHKEGRCAVMRAFNVFPALDELVVLIRPDLARGKVYVIDRAELEQIPPPAELFRIV